MCDGKSMPAHEFDVVEDEAGERLDVVLARRVGALSRARAKALVEDGLVRVDGRLRSKSHRLAVGEHVVIDELPPPSDFECESDDQLELDVVVETDHFVIVNKPPGVPSHPLRAGERGTLAGALVARYPEMRGVGYSAREPGIVHRLDAQTSGVMVAARSQEAFDWLRGLLRAGKIEKHYVARCVGEVEAPQVIDTPVANDPRDKRKVRACTDPREVKRLGALPARTEVLSSEPAPLGSLVTLRANHARRHQVRVHLASIGHPLLSDPLYGGPVIDDTPHHLHASALRIDNIWGQAPLPKHMQF